MSSTHRIAVVLVEPQTLLRRGYERILSDAREVDLLGAFANAKDMLKFLDENEQQVRMIIISAGLVFGKDGETHADVLAFLKRMYPTISVVLLASSHTDPESEEQEIFRAIRSGVAAYIPSDREPEQLVDTLRAVSSGHYSIDDFVLQRPSLAKRVVRYFVDVADQSPEGDFSPFAPLSKRERQILELIAQKGYSNKEVARELSISDQTVKNHMSSIMRKLNVNDRTQAVVTAMQHRWITVETPKAAPRGSN